MQTTHEEPTRKVLVELAAAVTAAITAMAITLVDQQTVQRVLPTRVAEEAAATMEYPMELAALAALV